MKLLLAFVFALSCFCASAQKARHVAFDLAPSLHGSGDGLGPFVNIEYGKYFKKRLLWTTNFSATINSSSQTLLFVNGVPVEGHDFREVTAGVQVGGQLWVAPARSTNHELRFGLGPLVRFQSASNTGGWSTVVVRNPDPVPAVIAHNREPMNIFTAGYQFGLVYAYTFPKGFLLGLKAGLQNDTNADIITHVGLRVGKRF